MNLLGIEYDLASDKLSIGLSSSMRFAVGIGVEGHVIQMLELRF